MGADFVFNYVALKHNNLTREQRKENMLKEIDNFKIPELSDNIKQKILSVLQDENSKEFNKFCELWEEYFFGDFDEKLYPVETNDKNEEEKITEQRAREIMKEVVEEFFDYINSREVGQFEFKGYTILLTGGMSYGDNPTSVMEFFNKISNLPEKIMKAGELE